MPDHVTAPSTRGLSGTGATPPAAGADWPARAADLVEDVVSMAHDRVIRPLLLVARAAVFGILVAAMALAVSILLAIAVVRVLDTYAFGHRVWASEALVGTVITLVGLLAWSRRRARGAERVERVER
jgi:hypothetical protein